MSEVPSSGNEEQPPEWSVLDGKFNPDSTPISIEAIEGLDRLIRGFKEEAAERVGLVNLLTYALEVVSPELPPSASTDIVRVSKSVASKYTKESLTQLKRLTPPIDVAPPPVVNALTAIFDIYQETRESDEDKRLGGIDLKAKAYGVVRILHLMQSDRQAELPHPLD